MEAAALLKLVDLLIAGITTAANAAGAYAQVSAIVQKRLAENRDHWTDEERASVEQALVDAKAYAQQQLGLPDAPSA